MKGDPQVLEALKDVLKAELTAINQSFLHARMCADWGYEGLGRKIRKESIVKMEHAEKLIDRILFLESMPNLRDMFPLRIGKDVGQIHKNGLVVGRDIAARANKGVETAAAQSDDTSRELLESILTSEEEYIDWLEAQLQVIEDAGLGLYLARQMRR